MTAIVLAAAGGVTCAAGIALYAGLKARRQAPVVTWRAWAEGFPVRAVSWGLAVAVTLAILAGAAAAIDARVTSQGPPRASRGGDVALPQHLSLPALTPGSARRSHHRRGGAQPGSPAASAPSPMVHPAPTLPVPGSHPPAPSPTPTQTPTPTPGLSPTPTPTPTPSLGPTPTPSLGPTPTPSLSPTPTPSLSPTPTVVPSPTATATPSPYGENR